MTDLSKMFDELFASVKSILNNASIVKLKPYIVGATYLVNGKRSVTVGIVFSDSEKNAEIAYNVRIYKHHTGADVSDAKFSVLKLSANAIDRIKREC